MKVLIVHDRESIAAEIESVVRRSCGEVETKTVFDGLSARAALTSSFYDLLIIDLTLPSVKGRAGINFQVAETLLEELGSESQMFTPASILGITQDTEALELVQNNIGPHVMVIIREDVEGEWKAQLSQRLSYVLRSSTAVASSVFNQFDYDVLIVTALDKELSPFRDFFELSELAGYPGVEIFRFTDKRGVDRRGATFAIGRAGQPSAASETQGLLCRLRPRLAIMTGFCGGIPGKADLGDILFSELAFDWDYGKWKPTESASRLYARPEPISIRNDPAHRLARQIVDRGVLERDVLEAGLSRLSNSEITKVVFRLAPFASGSAVIGDANILPDIAALSDNIAGVDMENFAFYYACKHTHGAKAAFICIKAVADDCGPDKDDRLHRACSFASAQVAREIISVRWDFSI